MSNFPATSPSSSSHLRMILQQSLSPVCLQPHDHVYCSIDDMTTLDVHYPTVVELHRFYSHCQPRVRTTCPSIAHVISHITSNELLLQYCHVSVCIPFGLTFQLHSQTICFTTSPFSPHYLHTGGFAPSCQYGISYMVGPESLFLACTNKCFCLDLPVCFS